MLKVYNTLTGKKDVLKTDKAKNLRLFVCGPTVYDFAHIGHARTYISFDLMVKYLKQKGWSVFYLQNITDIDDKIIQRAKEKETSPKKLALNYEKEYLKNMKELKIDSVTKYARATDNVKEIISQVERIMKKGTAYKTGDGIYFDIKKFEGYGKLSKRTALQAEDSVSRIDQAVEKKNKGDFCLWKFSKPEEPSWPSPWGKGRPGWHIEDTAIAEKYFGLQYDVHGGARDLIFPHHEAEIAQMETISGKEPMVKYWLHTGFLTVKGQKMAKSLNNFITINGFLENNSARILRFMVSKTHYRSPLDYTENSLIQAKRELERIDEFTERLKKQKARKQIQGMERLKEEFEKAMEDDFNTPKAVSFIFEIVNKGNQLMDKDLLGKKEAEQILEFFKEKDRFLQFLFWPKEKIPQEIKDLAQEREKQRKKKNWQEADRIRKEMEDLGWQPKDTEKGTELKKI